MGSYSALAALGALTIALFSVFARRAVETWDKKKYRELASSVFWATLPVASMAVIVISLGDVPLRIQNFALGALGAMVGAALFIWLGYIARDAIAGAQPTQPTAEATPMTADDKATANVAGNNNIVSNVTGNDNVVSIGQTGGVTARTYINQVPQQSLI